MTVSAANVPSVFAARGAGTLVLLVDDHPTNREVLMQQLRVLGYASEEAPTSHEALRMWQADSYGLMITDCDMPDMDGYQLSRAIRRQEADMGRPRMPILAWTANAQKEAVIECEEAGMDDILVKPANLAALRAKLDSLLPLPVMANQATPAALNQAGPPLQIHNLLDPAPLRELSGGDATMEAKILVRFLKSARIDAAALNLALNQGDTGGVARLAHRMKGAAGMIGATELAQACEALEQAGRGGDPAQVATVGPRFHAAFEPLVQLMEKMGQQDV